MSSTRSRILSGSGSSWLKILLALSAQILTVPIFLSHWTASEYGYWLLFLTFTPFIQLLDQGHQTYVGYECLKLGPDRKDKVERYIADALVAGAAVGIALLVLLITTYCWFLYFTSHVDGSFKLKNELYIVLIIHCAAWITVGAPLAIMTKGLMCFGFFPRFNWWSLFFQAVTITVPIVLVANGFSYLETGLSAVLSGLFANFFIAWDLHRILKKLDIKPRNGKISFGGRRYAKSTILAVSVLSENLRQQGVRILMAPLVSVKDLVTFSTVRTGANIALQGLSTITQPVMPEIMRFLREKSHAKLERSFGLIWAFSTIVLGPSLILLQLVVPEIYPMWTRGKVEFDGNLFAVFSSTIAIYALYQPNLAIVQGNNLLKAQLIISVGTGTILILGVIGLTPFFGILGVAWALLIAEVASAICYSRIAYRWVRDQGFAYPSKSFINASISTFLLIFALQMLTFRHEYNLSIISVYILLTAFFAKNGAMLAGLKIINTKA